ncbi:hypothetical protein Tco_1336973 [Tanacetum coccineum]
MFGRRLVWHVPLGEIKVDKTLHFVEEPVEIMDREVKSLKRSKIALVKVRWNSKRGPKFTWECKDYMKSKYPQLFVDRDDRKSQVNTRDKIIPKGCDTCNHCLGADSFGHSEARMYMRKIKGFICFNVFVKVCVIPVEGRVFYLSKSRNGGFEIRSITVDSGWRVK